MDAPGELLMSQLGLVFFYYFFFLSGFSFQAGVLGWQMAF